MFIEIDVLYTTYHVHVKIIILFQYRVIPFLNQAL